MLRRGGVFYSTAYAARWVIDCARDFMDRRLASVERRKGLVEPWTIGARRYTVAENKQLWNAYDWSQRGEEWTRTAEWKETVLARYLFPNVPEGGTVLEIGPGGGRWTEVLQRRAGKLLVVDISERVIAMCRERFAGCANVDYRVGTGSTLDAPDAAFDALWSYDVFVHINPLDARGYFREFMRVLKPGAKAVVHHPGSGSSPKYREVKWRSDLTDQMVLEFARESGLEVVFQTTELVNEGDVLSVLRKPV
jgi:ubiquinone/menaquinone biosynthesis C-methylase UbiE